MTLVSATCEWVWVAEVQGAQLNVEDRQAVLGLASLLWVPGRTSLHERPHLICGGPGVQVNMSMRVDEGFKEKQIIVRFCMHRDTGRVFWGGGRVKRVQPKIYTRLNGESVSFPPQMAEVLYLTSHWDSIPPKMTQFSAMGDLEWRFGGQKLYPAGGYVGSLTKVGPPKLRWEHAQVVLLLLMPGSKAARSELVEGHRAAAQPQPALHNDLLEAPVPSYSCQAVRQAASSELVEEMLCSNSTAATCAPRRLS
eukprot:1138155-Pelagomonas_calceolata.AAC.2